MTNESARRQAGLAPRSDRSDAVTRRNFLKSTALAAAAAFMSASIARPDSISANGANSERLATGWEYFRGSLGGVWDVWRGDMAENTVWTRVEVPHCFNAHDAVDPE